MMPQKRNPFVLEHVQGKSAAALGTFVTAASAMRGSPFTNSIAVGTEAVAPAVAALDATADAVTIMRLVYSGLRPNPEAMASGAAEGLTAATAAAEWLALRGTPFRLAHHRVGVAVREVLDGRADSLYDALDLAERSPADPPPDLEPSTVWQRADYGGGPGATSFASAFEALARSWMRHRAAVARRQSRWTTARETLDDAIATMLAPAAGPAETGLADTGLADTGLAETRPAEDAVALGTEEPT
jgi:argininosuccinate lyase